jgi:16S rRNA G527 N7-methylase RsmG
MFGELLRSKLAGICELSEWQIERLRLHYELLTRWNKVLSLTSVRTVEEAVERLGRGRVSRGSLSGLCGQRVQLC